MNRSKAMSHHGPRSRVVRSDVVGVGPDRCVVADKSSLSNFLADETSTSSVTQYRPSSPKMMARRRFPASLYYHVKKYRQAFVSDDDNSHSNSYCRFKTLYTSINPVQKAI